ncbi:universal stress protein [Salinadaptatus halalkaliphilus]|uniref:Universal stress protein n=1 Tax=Salinadaptatus halalkaliphilus TaxID=2419781 RepID=A0A4S3TQG1_9EURY|nr:universal stress protein [Salinadaptatus halalkaliphilus]THE66516.1 universal stress protein [Salinadaptatus halalkaliphilus]
MTDHILVPYDGSEPAEHALEYALEMFSNADVTALYVVPTPEGYWGSFDGPEERVPNAEKARERGEEILEEATDVSDEYDAEIDTAVRLGTPDHEIVAYAEDEAVETIVMGSHGREGIERVLLGSVAENVVQRAPVSVMVVR